VVSVVAASAPAGASPLDVLGLGSRRAGQAGAGIAAADDAAAVFYNPAGLLGRPACRRAAERDRHGRDDSDRTRREPDDESRGERDAERDDDARGTREDDHRGNSHERDDRSRDARDDDDRGERDDASEADAADDSGPRPRRDRDDDEHDRASRDRTADERTTDEGDSSCDAATRTGELVVGMAGEYSHLSINGVRAPLADAGAAQIATRVLLASRFALGVAISSPSSHLAYSVVRVPEQPYYPYYRDRLSRAVLLLGAGVRLTDELAVGGSLDLTPGFTRSRGIAGVTARLSPSLRAGLAYHQRFALVDDATDVRVHYTPHQVIGGIAYTTDAIVATLDGGWARWSGFRGPYPLGVETPAYKDTFSVRFGAESTATSGTSFRAGYAFESSAIPASQPITNLLDGTKHTVTGGAGYAAGRLRVDAHVLITIVTTRTLERMDQPKLKSGGELFGAGVSVTRAF
jgi:hypothetical protein